MNEEDHSDVVSSLRERYQNSSVPTALIDRELQVLWANQAAFAVHPGFRLHDGLTGLVPDIFARAFLRAVEEGSWRQTWNFDLPFSNRTFSLIPLEGGTDEPLFIMHSVVSNEVGTALKPAGSERLLSAFSNQFRTPLTSIFSTLSVLRSNPILEDNLELNDHLERINENAYQLFGSYLKMTEYVRQRMTVQELDLALVDATDYLQQLCEAVGIVTSNHGIPLTYDLPEKEVLLVCDQGQLTQAILHLIDNSCRFTQEGNAISITLREAEKNVILSVRDRGQGIAPDIQERVFFPYFSHDPAGGPFAGLGLGLTLVRQIVQYHRGTVALTSSEGKGTTVVFTLPKGNPKNLSLRSPTTSAGYLMDRFSPLYVLLSDILAPPKP